MEDRTKRLVLDHAYMSGKLIITPEDVTMKLVTDGNLLWDTHAMLLAASSAMIELNLISLRKVYTMSTLHSVFFNVHTHYTIGYSVEHGKTMSFNHHGMYSHTFDIGSPLVTNIPKFDEVRTCIRNR